MALLLFVMAHRDIILDTSVSKNRLFYKSVKAKGITDNVSFLPEFSSNTNLRCPVIVALLNSCGVMFTENILLWIVFHQQISYSSTSPELSVKNKYPYFYRTIPDDTSFSAPRVALLKTFKWSHVGVIFQEEDIHRTVTITPTPKTMLEVGRGRWTEKPCVGKSAYCPSTFDQDCCTDR